MTTDVKSGSQGSRPRQSSAQDLVIMRQRSKARDHDVRLNLLNLFTTLRLVIQAPGLRSRYSD
jgi:hypothetical protein